MRTKTKKTKWAEYEEGKRALKAQSLTAKEYEERLRRLAARLGV